MKRNYSQKGFTLVEILVSVFVFSLILGAATSLLFSSLSSQRRILATQQLVSQTNFLQEYMSRALRQAKKELGTPPGCLTSAGRGYNYEITNGGEGIKFINSTDECQEFFLASGRIKESLDGVEQFLTPDEFSVTTLEFSVSGEWQGDNLQPRASFVMDIASLALGKAESAVNLVSQTTISQRRIDIEQ